jgi:uncharacterized protein YukE
LITYQYCAKVYFIIFRCGVHMPNWNPNWTDTGLHHGAALQYAADCRQAARVLRSLLDDVQSATTMASEWRGEARSQFDDLHATWVVDSTTSAHRLEAIAHEVERIAAAARIDQAQREWDRQRWLFEDAAERIAAPVVNLPSSTRKLGS